MHGTTLYRIQHEKKISLANNPGSEGDAGSNAKPLTKQVTETACSPPEEVQLQGEETTQAVIILLPADSPPSIATKDVSPRTEAPSNPNYDPVPTHTSTRKHQISYSSSGLSPSSSSSSMQFIPLLTKLFRLLVSHF